jgi:hypothetical protein
MNKIPVLRSATALASMMLLLTLVFSSCVKFNDDTDDEPAAGVLGFNLAPDIASGGFTFSGTSLSSSPLAFGNYTGAYLKVAPGIKEVVGHSSGAAVTTPESFELEEQKYYSTFLLGFNNAYETRTVHDNFSGLSAISGKGYIRYINAVPDLVHPTITFTTSGGTHIVNENAEFTAISGFVEASPGELTIRFTNGGSIDTSRTITVTAAMVYTVMVTGHSAGTGDAAVQIRYISHGTLGG